MKHRLLPIGVGVITGWVAVFVLDSVNHMIYPTPADADLTTKEGVRALMESMPTNAYVLLFAGWMISAFTAGIVGTLLNREYWRNNVLVIGVILAISAIINMMLIPHPTWLMIGAGVGYVPLTYLGGSLFKRKN